jgi:hypothetical protein
MNFVLMRILQCVLLTAGLAALGTILGIAGIAFFVSLLQSNSGEPWQRGFGQYIGGFVCGAPLGAICGLIVGIAMARAQDGLENWSWMAWGGVFLGAMIGVWIAMSWSATSQYGLWSILLLALAFGTVGGFAGGLASASRPRRRKSK